MQDTEVRFPVYHVKNKTVEFTIQKQHKSINGSYSGFKWFMLLNVIFEDIHAHFMFPILMWILL